MKAPVNVFGDDISSVVIQWIKIKRTRRPQEWHENSWLVSDELRDTQNHVRTHTVTSSIWSLTMMFSTSIWWYSPLGGSTQTLLPITTTPIKAEVKLVCATVNNSVASHLAKCSCSFLNWTLLKIPLSLPFHFLDHIGSWMSMLSIDLKKKWDC